MFVKRYIAFKLKNFFVIAQTIILLVVVSNKLIHQMVLQSTYMHQKRFPELFVCDLDGI